MANRADLDLAKQLLAHSVLTQERLREALAVQSVLEGQGKVVGLARVLVGKGILPREAYETLTAKDPLEAQPFPNYRLDRALGEGGSSVVYGGVYVPNGAYVAVKVVNAVQSLRPDLLARFYDEARLLIELEHPNVVTGYEVGASGGRHFVSMDYIEGPTILQMIERAGAVDGATSIWITIQMAKALAYLHQQGLLHRDIKPGNVMIDASGRARLIDLGLVRRIGTAPPPLPGTPSPSSPAPAAEAASGEEAVTVGTVEYISPEQARGRGDLDVRTDIYSLGVSLYHMVVGDVPFHGESDYEVMAKHILHGLDSQKVKNRRIAPEVHYAITKMMSKEREHRYSDCDEVVKDLTRFLPAGGPPPIVLPVAPQAPSTPSVPKSPTVGRPRIRSSGEIRRRHNRW